MDRVGRKLPRHVLVRLAAPPDQVTGQAGNRWRRAARLRTRDGRAVLEDYLRLRRESGRTPRTPEQAAPALRGSGAICHVPHLETGEVVGMGRLLGDGGWYFHVVDMALLPAQQRRGIGDAVLAALLDRTRTMAPPAPT